MIRAEFLGTKQEELHGQLVDVKVFSSPSEPTIDFERLINEAMSATPAGVQTIWDEVVRYKCEETEWYALDKLEQDAIITAYHQPIIVGEYDDVDDRGMDTYGELLGVDELIGGNDEV